MPNGGLYTKENIKEAVSALQDKVTTLDLPFVTVQDSILGEAVDILFTCSLDARSAWKNNIFQNSRYFKLHLKPSGELTLLSKHYSLPKFRKTTVKTFDAAIKKIEDYIVECTKRTEVSRTMNIRDLVASELSVAAVSKETAAPSVKILGVSKRELVKTLKAGLAAINSDPTESMTLRNYTKLKVFDADTRYLFDTADYISVLLSYQWAGIKEVVFFDIRSPNTLVMQTRRGKKVLSRVEKQIASVDALIPTMLKMLSTVPFARYTAAEGKKIREDNPEVYATSNAKPTKSTTKPKVTKPVKTTKITKTTKTTDEPVAKKTALQLLKAHENGDKVAATKENIETLLKALKAARKR